MASGDDDHAQLDKAKRLFDEALLVCDTFFFVFISLTDVFLIKLYITVTRCTCNTGLELKET